MISSIQSLVTIEISSINSRLTQVIEKYSYRHITNLHDNMITQKVNEMEFIIINQCIDENNTNYFIVGLEKSLLLVEKSLIKILQPIFVTNPELTIYFLPDTMNSFSQCIEIPNPQVEIDHNYLEEITNFNENIIITQTSGPPISEINEAFSSCITGYLIHQSHKKTSKSQLIDFEHLFEKCQNMNKQIDEDDFILLRNLGYGSSSSVELIYLIENEELYAMKKFFNEESEKLIEREYNNYLSFNFPLFSKLLGKVKGKNCLIIQFINGKTLKNINHFKLSKGEKIVIIFEIMIAINYLHEKGFVYRDLKPNNVFFDVNKQIFIVDFDRMVKFAINSNYQDHTAEFQTEYVAPEVSFNKISYENDIYSIGQMIFYIINERNPCFEKQENNKKEFFYNNENLLTIYKRCTDDNINNRPSISELLFEFYLIYSSQIIKSNAKYFPEVKYFYGISNNEYESIKKDVEKAINYFTLAANQNYVTGQYNLGLIYWEGIYIQKDIKKAVQYLKLAADKNHLKAQLRLGLIYIDENCDVYDSNKAIYYLKLAANQNSLGAQLNLGSIYSNGKHVPIDINNAIYYYTLAANQQNVDAQFNLAMLYSKSKLPKDMKKAIHYFILAADQNHIMATYMVGCFYYKGCYVEANIKKAVHYFTLAANQYVADALFMLGCLYSNGEHLKVDIKKAIYYFTLAANQDHIEAQFNLGVLYYNGIYLEVDIKKAIYYFTLAANQNYAEAQKILGCIYLENRYVPIDVNKSIYYYSLAAENNHLMSQFSLGLIYYENDFIKRDINKSIYYFKLAAEQNYFEAQSYLGTIFYDNKYIARDINKAIYYYSLAAKQNDIYALVNLGKIYCDGNYVARDIYKAIYYFEIAADKNNINAQINLANIYYEGKYIKRNINKAIHYFSLAANNNDAESQFRLSYIFFEGKYIKQDINKAFYYLKLSVNQKYADALAFYGMIYYENKYVPRDISKAIYYLTLAANQNHSISQFNLGVIFVNGICVKKDPIRGIDFLIRSSLNGNITANFAVGFFYHEGKYVAKDIKKALHFYKVASSFNNFYAKNNLGIIYKHECKNLFPNNIGIAIAYFDESIQRTNDVISMYNLAHIYIYEDKTKEKIDESIELLIKSCFEFRPSYKLLCIALIKKVGFDLTSILNEIQKNIKFVSNLPYLIINMIVNDELNKQEKFEEQYEYYKNVDFIYNYMNQVISTKILNEKSKINLESETKQFLTPDFYDGFGFP